MKVNKKTAKFTIMKKSLFLALFMLVSATFTFAQPSCIQDIWQTLNNEQYIKAQKLMESCMVGNEGSAITWLVKGNVYLKLYDYENTRATENPSYKPRFPLALETANEAFFKAMEINPDVKPLSGMVSPTDGQLLCAYPIQEMGNAEKEKGNWDKAIEYIEKAIKSYKIDAKRNSLYIAYAYIDIATCYQKKGDDAKYLEYMRNSAELRPNIPELYTSLYDIYKAKNDTVNCLSILKLGEKAVPDSLAADIQGAYLDYYAFIGEQEKMQTMANEILAKYGNNAAVVSSISTQLINGRAYETAKAALNNAIATNPNNFDLTQTMADCYYFEAIDKQNEGTDIQKNSKDADKWDRINALKQQSDALFTEAHTWLEKAYQINNNDPRNVKMLRQLKLRFRMEVPADLQEKYDSFYKENK